MRTEYAISQEVEHVLALLTPPNRLVCRVMLHTGLRVGDVLALRSADLSHQFWIREAKTGKKKRVNLPGPLLAALKESAGPDWVFPGRKPGRHRTRQAVWADIKRAQRACRLHVNLGTHSMRKSYAVDLMSRYGDIKRVQRALNHDRYTTTVIYALADQLARGRASVG